MIEIKDISAGYLPAGKVLDNINCDIAEGSFCGIIGRNGAGKRSTKIGRASCRERV